MSQIDDHVQRIKVQGFTKLENFIKPETVDHLLHLTTVLFDELEGCVYPGYSEIRPNDIQIFNLQNKSLDFIRLLKNPTLLAILGAMLDDEYYKALEPDKHNFILGEYIARSSGESLKLHIDSWMPSSGSFAWMMQVAFSLQKRSAAHGCTRLVPGTHRSDQFSIRDFGECVDIETKAGDVVIWDSRLWHGAHQNMLQEHSWALIATFQRWWVKQRFNIVEALPEEIYSSLADEEKVLMGFASRPPRTEFHGTDMRGGLGSFD